MTYYFKISGLIVSLGFLGGCLKESNESVKKSYYSLDAAIKSENVIPIAIIGSGPAGLSAALYVSRAGMKSFVFAGPLPCGQLTQTTYIENWPGKERILGSALMNDIKAQAESFGATIIHDTITHVDTNAWPFTLKTEEGRSVKALSIILATGATPKALSIPGEQQYWGKGVTSCAICDAPFFKEKEVVICGGGDSAAEMVFELAPYVKKVTILVRKDRMRAAAAMQERIAQYPNATIEYHKEITKIYGDENTVTAIEVYDNKTKETIKRPISGVFLAIGHIPNTKLVKNQVPLDEHGYVKMIDRSQETLVKGVFAAGEIQDSQYRQAIVAAGEGVKAALDATSFLYSLGFTTAIGRTLDQHFFETFSNEKIEIPEITDKEELYAKVLQAKGVALLEFYGSACPMCVHMIPILESVAHKLQGKLAIYKVKYDDKIKRYRVVFKELWRKFDIKIQKVPALVIFKDGAFIEMTYDVMNKKELYTYLQKFL